MSKYKVGDKVLVEGVLKRIDENCDYPYQVRIADVHKIYFSEDELKDASKTYEDGLNDAWELAKKLYNLDCNTLEDIYGVDGGFYGLMKKYTAQEALAKIEAYEESKAIKVGDVVVADDGVKCVAIDFTSDDDVIVLNENGCAEAHLKSVFKKTGRHIDIEHLLEQIRGNE